MRLAIKRYDVSDATVWRWSANPEMGFPKPISLSPGVTVWDVDELLAFEATRAAAARGGK